MWMQSIWPMDMMDMVLGGLMNILSEWSKLGRNMGQIISYIFEFAEMGEMIITIYIIRCQMLSCNGR